MKVAPNSEILFIDNFFVYLKVEMKLIAPIIENIPKKL